MCACGDLEDVGSYASVKEAHQRHAELVLRESVRQVSDEQSAFGSLVFPMSERSGLDGNAKNLELFAWRSCLFIIIEGRQMLNARTNDRKSL